MQRNSRCRMQRPAETGSGEAESRRRRQHIHLGRIDMAGKRGADAMQEGIAGGEHADRTAAQANYRLDALLEWARPGAGVAGDQILSQGQVTFAAEDDFGGADPVLRGFAEPGNSVFADADDGQPAADWGRLAQKLSRHDDPPHSYSRRHHRSPSSCRQTGTRGDLDITLSLAGRTIEPAEQPVPVRSGGFGGAEGLARYLQDERIDLLIDATHPYAAQISRNADVAARLADVPAFALRRAPWQQVAGDRWTLVANAEEAVAALGAEPRRVFLALGRQEIGAFETAPQHSYLIRSVDPIEPPLDVPDAGYILARGPFAEAAERNLLAEHHIDAIVAKNSGGSATYGKIAAARELGIDVILFRRPEVPDMPLGRNGGGGRGDGRSSARLRSSKKRGV